MQYSQCCKSEIFSWPVSELRVWRAFWGPSWSRKVAYFYFQEALKIVKTSVDLFYITFIKGTLMRNNSYKLNWYYEYNIQEASNTKILSKYTFTCYLCSVISRNLHLFWPTKALKWSAMTDDRPLFATLYCLRTNQITLEWLLICLYILLAKNVLCFTHF